MAKHKYLRDFRQIEEDGLDPNTSIGGSRNRREQTIIEVLLRIPEEDYQNLADNYTKFQWFIPPVGVRGMVYPFFANIQGETIPAKKIGDFDIPETEITPYAKVIYMPAILEKASLDIIKAIAAHELAHIVLGHKITFIEPGEDTKQETEAELLVKRWGFEEELKKHQAVNKRLATLGK